MLHVEQCYLFASAAEHGGREGEVGPPPRPLPAPGAPKLFTQDEAAVGEVLVRLGANCPSFLFMKLGRGARKG
jgi:hypothetical protein